MILVGTIHIDIEGPKRLEHLLDRYSPRRISIEAPKDKSVEELEQLFLSNRDKIKQEISKWDFPEPLLSFATEIIEAYRYELLIPAEYTRQTGAEIRLVDHPGVVISYNRIDDYIRGFIEGYVKAAANVYSEKELSPSDVVAAVKKLREGNIRKVDAVYFDRFSEPNSYLMKTLIAADKQAKNLSYLDTEEFKEEREQEMADGILEFKPEFHIGGLPHAFEEYAEGFPVKPLYERLGNIVSKRIRLCEAMKE